MCGGRSGQLLPWWVKAGAAGRRPPARSSRSAADGASTSVGTTSVPGAGAPGRGRVWCARWRRGRWATSPSGASSASTAFWPGCRRSGSSPRRAAAGADRGGLPDDGCDDADRRTADVRHRGCPRAVAANLPESESGPCGERGVRWCGGGADGVRASGAAGAARSVAVVHDGAGAALRRGRGGSDGHPAHGFPTGLLRPVVAVPAGVAARSGRAVAAGRADAADVRRTTRTVPRPGAGGPCGGFWTGCSRSRTTRRRRRRRPARGCSTPDICARPGCSTGVRPQDAPATLALLTARTIADAVRFVGATEIVASGGASATRC